MKQLSNASILCLFCLSFVAFAQEGSDKAEGKTIRIDFSSNAGEGMKMNLTLPIGLLESFKPKIEEALSSIRVREHEIDFAAIWASVKDAGPSDFVEISNENEHIKVSTTESHLRVSVDSEREDQTIDISIPLALGDALFSDLENINYDHIIDVLLNLEGQDLVRIKSSEINARVWIE